MKMKNHSVEIQMLQCESIYLNHVQSYKAKFTSIINKITFLCTFMHKFFLDRYSILQILRRDHRIHAFIYKEIETIDIPLEMNVILVTPHFY